MIVIRLIGDVLAKDKSHFKEIIFSSQRDLFLSLICICTSSVVIL